MSQLNTLERKALELKAGACLNCPKKTTVRATMPAGVPGFMCKPESMKVRTTCGACDGNEVKPPQVEVHTMCKRFKRSESHSKQHNP